jgi:hypothetical protein
MNAEIPSYTCDACPYSLLCLAGKLSVHKRLPRSTMPRAFNGPDMREPPAFLCYECNVFYISGVILEEAVFTGIHCELRCKENLDLNRLSGQIKTPYEDPSPGGGWLAVSLCVGCAHERTQTAVQKYNTADADLTARMLKLGAKVGR